MSVAAFARLVLAVALMVAPLLLVGRTPSVAMPNFAQAYGVDCSKCHTAVPTLNAYGRYVQRTQYAYLDAATVQKAFPLWVGYQANYDSQDPVSPHKVVWGNGAVHADGLAGDNWSYHVQQWLWNKNVSGGLDTAWVSYNNLFKHDGHLEIGKMVVPAPSPYSMWAEIAPFATPEITVGEHTYQLDANRWGAKLGFVRGSIDVEAAYVGSDADLNGASDFNPANGRALQYQVAYMRPKNPLEVGVYGASGMVPLAEGGSDFFSAIAGYVQRDPSYGVPGVFLVYQTTHDGNPGGGSPASTGHAYTISVYEPIFKGDALIGLRREMTDDGLGTITHSANIDLSIRVAKYLRLYTEAGLAQHGTPSWRAFIWWTTPVVAKARK